MGTPRQRNFSRLIEPSCIVVIQPTNADDQLSNSVFFKLPPSFRQIPSQKRARTRIVRFLDDAEPFPSETDLVVTIDLSETVLSKAVSINAAGILILRNLNAPTPLILKRAADHGILILGPGGFSRLSIGLFIGIEFPLNNSTAEPFIPSGSVALLTQTIDLCNQAMKFASKHSCGVFSTVMALGLSTGDPKTVSFADSVNHFSHDINTTAVIFVVKELPASVSPASMRQLISSARAYSRNRPVFTTFSDTWKKEDQVSSSIVPVLSDRTGVADIKTLPELFFCALALSNQPMPRSERLCIVTNSSEEKSSVSFPSNAFPATLSPKTISKLTPSNAKIDIPGLVFVRNNCLGDTIEACLECETVDCVILLLDIFSIDSSFNITQIKSIKRSGNPLYCCFLSAQQEGAGIQQQQQQHIEEEIKKTIESARIPVFDSLSITVQTVKNLCISHTAVRKLIETPPFLPGLSPNISETLKILDSFTSASSSSPTDLPLEIATQIFEYYGIAYRQTPLCNLQTARIQISLHNGWGLLLHITDLTNESKHSIGIIPMHMGHAILMLQNFIPSSSCIGLAALICRLSRLVCDTKMICDSKEIKVEFSEDGSFAQVFGIPLIRVFKQSTECRVIFAPVPRTLKHNITLRNGTVVTIRPAEPADEMNLKKAFESMSESDKQFRFLSPPREFSHEMIARLTQLDYDRGLQLLASITNSSNEEQIVGICGYITDEEVQIGEQSIVVFGEWQNLGLGSVLLEELYSIAEKFNVKELWADTSKQNPKIIKILRKTRKCKFTIEDDSIHTIVYVSEKPETKH